MNNDIEGIERSVIGFSKQPDENGEYLVVVEYKLNNPDLTILRKIFEINIESKDWTVLDMINPISINSSQAQQLQQYVSDGIIDTNKYDFELHCYQAPGYDWSDGYPKKIDSH